MTKKASIQKDRKDKLAKKEPPRTHRREQKAADISTNTSVTDSIAKLSDDISNLRKEIQKGNKEENYHYHVGKAFTFVAMGLGIQFLPVSSFTNVPPVILALLMYVIAGLEIATAFESHHALEGWHKWLYTIGLIVVAAGTTMVSLPFLRILPASFVPFGLPTIVLGGFLMEISILSGLIKKATNHLERV